jgi:hypothetical protein
LPGARNRRRPGVNRQQSGGCRLKPCRSGSFRPTPSEPPATIPEHAVSSGTLTFDALSIPPNFCALQRHWTKRTSSNLFAPRNPTVPSKFQKHKRSVAFRRRGRRLKWCRDPARLTNRLRRGPALRHGGRNAASPRQAGRRCRRVTRVTAPRSYFMHEGLLRGSLRAKGTSQAATALRGGRSAPISVGGL